MVSLVFVLSWGCDLQAQTNVPGHIFYQGYLQQGGSPVEGNKNVTFKLYSGSETTTVIWTDTQTVDCTKGIFTAKLGPLDIENLGTQSQLWLGLTIEGSELTPRQQIVSVVYSLLSAYAGTATYAITAGTGTQGPMGLTGATGTTGLKGDKGDKGDTGDTGATGTTGLKGDKGDTGETGATGTTGQQ
ncbi:MAG: hypothetical protein HY964_00120, partial [Ignavibacteriales bacterium]|nr:hypothetical protein [Ignavibacteriales bacterium]